MTISRPLCSSPVAGSRRPWRQRLAGLRTALLFVAGPWLCAAASCLSVRADDRLTVVVPPAGQDSAEKLLGSLAMACNRGDFIAFMDHFTPTHGRRIRPRMEDIFIQHQPRMDIRQVILLSETDEQLVFGVRYAWHGRNQPEEVLSSKVAARRVNGQWKLDRELVRAVARTGSESDSAAAAGGRVVPAAWNPFDPPAGLINPALEHLRGDIGIQPGRGCANGRCGQ